MTIQQLRRLSITILLAVPISFLGAFVLASFTTRFESCLDCATPIEQLFSSFILFLTAGKVLSDGRGVSSAVDSIWPVTHSLWAMFLPVALIAVWLTFQRQPNAHR